MKILLLGLLALGFVAVAPVDMASAKCYRFSNAPSDHFFCVKGDSFSDRKKAGKCCKSVAGRSCGSVGSTSSSCHSNSNKCYDQNCKAHRSLRGYARLMQRVTFKQAVQRLFSSQ